ncbi:MAG: TolC family protein [candidate division Zixibacteria bacterium]
MADFENMRKIIKNSVLSLIAISMVIGFAYPMRVFAEPVKLGLTSAIEIALLKNESYQIARKELEKADGQVMEAVAGALPQITGNLSYLKNWRVPVGVFQMDGETVTFKFGTDNSYVADLTLTQPLYAGGRTFTALKIARTYKKMVREIVFNARQSLRVSVFESFYGAALAGEIHRVNNESFEFARQNLDVVQNMFDQGMAAEYDLLRAKVTLANLEPDVIRSLNNRDVALSALKNLLGMEPTIEIELEIDSDSTQFLTAPLNKEEALSELKQNRPEIIISGYETRLRDHVVSLSKAGYKPSLMFSTSLQYQAQFNRGSVFDKKWDRSLNSAIVLSVPIFDSWRTPSKVKQARVEYAQSRLKEESVVKFMILDYDRSLGRYNEARKRLASQGGAVELARRGLDIANLRYENGVGTQLEVSDARLALARAEINRAMAFHDLAIGYASLLRALGREVIPVK